ncbi:hypothetical protein TBC1_111127 [Lentimicrobium saccharophilum]|uniref:Uncharacterized protein n=1 Tax=Lentimicrobium saccharophilum TaxID=1678841 RepID=A0A0S7C1I8_9BACT|nr:hypothetical protein [Lentimicrobium saccharophilum]GAP42985.1 hypothetical protein TBC1_111127 [Lentimicrobium saccharophilum]
MRGKLPIARLLFLFVFIAILSGGCEKKDDASLVPSYLFIEKIGLNTQYEQGTASHKITDAWVYVDETLIGAFELPATVPILSEGLKKVTIRPGIKLNGISGTRAIYPYFAPIVKDIVLVRDSVIQVTDTVTSYRQGVLFPWMESFELSSMTLDTTAKSTVRLQRTNDPALRFNMTGEPGEYSGFVHLPADTSIFEAVTSEAYDFPAAGSEVFLEMNYKTDNALVVGVFYLSSGMQVQRPLLILNKSENWNKVYVNLTVPKYDTPNATDFRIFFGAQTDEGMEQAGIYLDNLKLIYFNTAK